MGVKDCYKACSLCPRLKRAQHRADRLVGSYEESMAVKSKTHSGAKKRLVKLASGKVKRRKAGRRHLLSPHSAKGMRQLKKNGYVHSANMEQTKRLLNF